MPMYMTDENMLFVEKQGAAMEHETIRTECDCGTPHFVEPELVGCCLWWKCPDCLDAEHAKFVRDMGWKCDCPACATGQ